ncbi:MAG: hypothetical protein P8J32_02700 [bacterium]|jgi:hypothetical protein|nr:hypothetical protein [bacterium]
MDPKTIRVFTVAITTFIPWLITLAALGASLGLPRPLFIFLHYTLDVLLFGVAFSIYYRGHPGVDPFTVTLIAMASLLIYEIFYLSFIYKGELWFLTYLDWIVPAFLIATTVYILGKIIK